MGHLCLYRLKVLHYVGGVASHFLRRFEMLIEFRILSDHLALSGL